jgi:predicted ArsR family transcriptional regulator
MTGTTVESIFGVNAGIVWKALNQNGPCTIEDLVKNTSLSREEVYGALGWLGRENKISVEMQERARGRRAKVFSLRQLE